MQLFYYRDPILAEPKVNISMQLHVMTGKARLRAKICAVNFTDKYENYSKECVFTKEEMLLEDPKEKLENHLGQETETTDPEICKLPPSTLNRQG